MRIIAGEKRGHRIVAPKGPQTRPTADRVREALYSILGPVDDAAVLDLFAGSGALGLEALSRGARRCVFADTDRAACRAIRENLEHLRLTGALVLQRDAVGLLREEATAGRRYDLVLMDPPYDAWPTLQGRLADVLPGVLGDDGVVAVETEGRVEPQLPLTLLTTRRYGSARITLFTP